MEPNDVATVIVDAAIKVHRALEPGLLESAYQLCFAYELQRRGLKVNCEVPTPIIYEDIRIDTGYRVDMIVEDCVIVENKTVDLISPIHEAQLLTYLKLRDCHLGFILNWNVKLMKNGIKRMVLNLPETSSHNLAKVKT
jgi:GxxExxY protein